MEPWQGNNCLQTGEMQMRLRVRINICFSTTHCSYPAGSLANPSFFLGLEPYVAHTCSGLAGGSVFLARIAFCRVAFSTWMARSTAKASSSRSSAAYMGLRGADRGLSRRLPGPGKRKQVVLFWTAASNPSDTTEEHSIKQLASTL